MRVPTENEVAAVDAPQIRDPPTIPQAPLLEVSVKPVPNRSKVRMRI